MRRSRSLVLLSTVLLAPLLGCPAFADLVPAPGLTGEPPAHPTAAASVFDPFPSGILNGVGQSKELTLTEDPDEDVVVRWDRTVAASAAGGMGFNFASASLGLKVFKDTGSGWVEHASRSYFATASSGQSNSDSGPDSTAIAGLAAGDKIKIEVTAHTESTTGDASATALADPDGAEYQPGDPPGGGDPWPGYDEFPFALLDGVGKASELTLAQEPVGEVLAKWSRTVEASAASGQEFNTATANLTLTIFKDMGFGWEEHSEHFYSAFAANGGSDSDSGPDSTVIVGLSVGDRVKIEVTGHTESTNGDASAVASAEPDRVQYAGLAGVVVTPKGGSLSGAPGSSGSLTFSVKNTGGGAASFNLSVDCTGTVTGCDTSPASIDTLDPWEVATVEATYDLGSSGTGVLKFVATQEGNEAVQDSGWANIAVFSGTPEEPVVSVADMNPGTTLERSLCVIAGVGGGAASECGDLRLTHALPTTRTFNRPRTPVLLYNSQHAHPFPLAAALVTLPAGAGIPDSVTATLKEQTVPIAHFTWSGTLWSPGETRRIVVGFDGLTEATGVHQYTLEVANWYGDAPETAAAESVTAVIVNRSESPFGAGWWLAGLEQLLPIPGSSDKLWVGGDGSTRRYVEVGGGEWVVTPPLDRPDTLVETGSGFLRRLPSGTAVHFNASGQHVATVNRLEHETAFTYSGSSLVDPLTKITLPVPSGAPAREYLFSYDGNGKLNEVTAPPIGSTARETTLMVSGGVVAEIEDPDGASVAFTYDDGPFARRVKRRTDRLGNVTEFGYDPAQKLARGRVFMNGTGPGGADLVTELRTLESEGFPPHAKDPTESYLLVQGPRVDVADTTLFHLDDRLLAPAKVVDALGGVTQLARGDATFPALVTRIEYPNGRVLGAVHDARGNVTMVTDSTNANATTVYRYQNSSWPDFVTTIVPPEGDSIRRDYEVDTGNLAWQQDARGSVSRDTLRYFDSGPHLHQLRATQGPVTPPDSLAYDTHGNLWKTRTPVGFWSEFLKDDVGRDSLVLTPTDSAQTSSLRQKERIAYDLMDRVTETERIGAAIQVNAWQGGSYTTPAETLFVRNFYNAEGAVDSVSRWVSPDPNGIQAITTRWRYDRALRPIAEIDPLGAEDRTFYDRAGNSTLQITRRGHVVSMTYDALGRLTERALPQVVYSPWAILTFTLPLYPNSGSSWAIAADTETFTYDAVGNLLTAENADARISRHYNRDGTLAADTLRIRTYTGSDFDQHIYGLRHGYDLNGRRIWTKHPEPLAPRDNGIPQDSVGYSYTDFGALAAVRDVMGNTFSFDYDAAGRLVRRILPGGVTDTLAYDADNRLIRRLLTSTESYRRPDNSFSTIVFADTISYDARGKVVRIDTWGDSTQIYYTGLGTLAHSETREHGANWTRERYRTDALGNPVALKREGPQGTEFQPRADSVSTYGYEPGVGRQIHTIGGGTFLGESFSANNYADTTIYDAAGNRHRYASNMATSTGIFYERHAYFYGADERLRALDKRTCLFDPECNTGSNPSYDQRGAFEEHRYDALGRRVLVRTRSEVVCNASDCDLSVRRFVWDGDQLLYETRYPAGGGAGTPLATIEQDTGTVGHTDGFGPYGRVAYTHGAEIDLPLGMIRMDYNTVNSDSTFQEDEWVTPQVVIPHADWKGRFAIHSFDTGEFERCVDDENALTCMVIGWPAPHTFQGRRANLMSGSLYDGWMGSLKDGHRDASGQIYQRNRFYDPQSGRFTQEDPIGLAGGVNLYGFAAGDPVNFSDPFGLRPCPPDCSPFQKATITLFTGAGGIVGAAGGAVAGTVVLPVAGTAGGGAGGFLVGSAEGAVLGLAVANVAGALQEAAPRVVESTKVKVRELIGQLGLIIGLEVLPMKKIDDPEPPRQENVGPPPPKPEKPRGLRFVD